MRERLVELLDFGFILMSYVNYNACRQGDPFEPEDGERFPFVPRSELPTREDVWNFAGQLSLDPHPKEYRKGTLAEYYLGQMDVPLEKEIFQAGLIVGGMAQYYEQAALKRGLLKSYERANKRHPEADVLTEAYECAVTGFEGLKDIALIPALRALGLDVDEASRLNPRVPEVSGQGLVNPYAVYTDVLKGIKGALRNSG